MQKRRKSDRTANSRLSPALTNSFISDLQNVLELDGSDEAVYLSKYLLTKFCELDTKKAGLRRSAAIAKWRTVEERNGLTNAHLKDDVYLDHPANEVGLVKLRHLLAKAREYVHDVIGDSPSLDVAHAMYSGGASTSRRRTHGHPAMKFLGRADATRHMWLVFQRYFSGTAYGRYITESGMDPRFVDGSILFTVPKNADIDRVACKEPDLNVFVQKSFGNQIRYLLKRKGIDLNDQTVNGELARQGSITGGLATLDLSSASDSVTVELVRWLLPPDWFYYLDAARSHTIAIDGANTSISMFSSMGNGFTFELESLIFYSLARAVNFMLGLRGRISVYGDDIIVPTESAPYLIQLLKAVGFTVNSEKSFTDGPFRESCGAYWHNGVDVKPFFIKGPITTISDLIKVLNQLTSWSSRPLGIVDPRYEALILKYRESVPEKLWGGQDVTSITSLVTGHAPRCELREVVNAKKQKSVKHTGGFLMWLQVTVFRQSAGSVQITGSSNTNRYRVRRNLQYRRDIPVFLSGYLVDEAAG